MKVFVLQGSENEIVAADTNIRRLLFDWMKADFVRTAYEREHFYLMSVFENGKYIIEHEIEASARGIYCRNAENLIKEEKWDVGGFDMISSDDKMDIKLLIERYEKQDGNNG